MTQYPKDTAHYVGLGQEAFARGENIAKCPLRRGSWQASAWSRGWLSADSAQRIVEFTCRKCAYTWRARYAIQCPACKHAYLTRKPC